MTVSGRLQIRAALGPEDRAVFDEAYATADVEIDLAGIAYRAREAAGLTQAELARKVGTTRSAIAALESGARAPTAAVFAFLVREVSRRLIISIGRDAAGAG